MKRRQFLMAGAAAAAALSVQPVTADPLPGAGNASSDVVSFDPKVMGEPKYVDAMG